MTSPPTERSRAPSKSPPPKESKESAKPSTRDRSRSPRRSPPRRPKNFSGLKWKNNDRERGDNRDRDFRGNRDDRRDRNRDYGRRDERDRGGHGYGRDGGRDRRDDDRGDRRNRDRGGNGGPERDFDRRREDRRGDDRDHRRGDLDDRERERKPKPKTTDKAKAPPAAAPVPAIASGEPMITVTVNDRLGTKAQIPCLGSDSVKVFKALVAAKIGRAPHEIMLKRQGERPFKDHITLGDYGVSNAIKFKQARKKCCASGTAPSADLVPLSSLPTCQKIPPTRICPQAMRLALSQLPLPHSFSELPHHCHRVFFPCRNFHRLSRVPRRVRVNQRGRGAIITSAMAGYENWSQGQLIAKIQELEAQIKEKDLVVITDPTKPSSATFTLPPIPPLVESSTDPQILIPVSIPHRKEPKLKPKPRQSPKIFDASKYSTRLIALKFAYLGQKYNGFEHHRNNTTPLPTIEEELWKALVKTRLITPVVGGGDTGSGGGDESVEGKREGNGKKEWEREGARDVNWEGCEYSKCGRTDRGVSAFGQVIGIRVRSNRPLPKSASSSHPLSQVQDQEKGEVSVEGVDVELSPFVPVAENMTERQTETQTEKQDQKPPFNDLHDELPYIQLLNRVLPPDIRIYAWCPDPPPNFSARFHCKERRYKYFFTNPCFAPVPGSSGLYNTPSNSQPMREGWLDIAAMKSACSSLIGLHDFRNMCKIDASKQLSNFKRRIFHASIEEVSPVSLPSFLSHAALQSPPSSPATSHTTTSPKIYAFELHGSAFLWHQVRSIVALLFLVGQGLESPSLIASLLDTTANPTRPKYEMASDAPLVLWDCIFPFEHEVQTADDRETGYEDRLRWVYVGDEGGAEVKGKMGRGGVAGVAKGKWGRGGVIDDVWEVWRSAKMEETLSALLLDSIAAKGASTLDAERDGREEMDVGIGKAGPRGFDGGDVGRARGGYIKVLQRERQEMVEVINERYARKKGWESKREVEDGDE
ncbi:pseudouridine synthase [Melanomma pulvis-pyrius CBS 109.77]|uniref:Pseudouridine synthase n=1 Tax=Melanomma pulvis-pyrius CBS 109.77 TaxID=1314802 RepID=A0A6A6X419_9PLEO|nr:pseudouridine synthase [Melanomma pulvis-pyrius CBS 109.77]